MKTEELGNGVQFNIPLKHKFKTGYNVLSENSQIVDAEELEVYRFLIGGMEGK